MTKSLLVLVSYLMAGLAAAAGLETQPNFIVDAKILANAGPRTFVEVLKGQELEAKFPDFYALDAFQFAARKGAALVIRKQAYLVDRPVGYFNDQLLLSEGWLEHTRGEALTRVDENHFRGRSRKGTFGLDAYFDSDDISNVQDRRLIHAMTKTKQLDPLSGSSSATVVMVKHSKRGRPKEVVFVNYISLNAKQSIAIRYGLSVMKWTGDASRLKKVREGIIAETPALVQRTNTY